MPNKNNNAEFETLRTFVTTLFEHDEQEPRGIVAQPDQQQELRSLQDTIGSERFYFVVDLPTFELREAQGIQRWLGYHEKEFSLKQYWGIVHPGKQKGLRLVAEQLYQMLCSGRFKLEFMVQRYSSLVALRHWKDHYLLVKKTSSVFQYDTNNRLLSYLNEFTIVGEYNNEPLMPRIFTQSGDHEERGDEVLRNAMKQFEGMKIFSPKELQTARRIAYNPGITQAAIAKEQEVSVHTIDTYCKRFLKKAREFFSQDFSSVADAALYLRKEGLL
jgi:hypothetical protein